MIADGRATVRVFALSPIADFARAGSAMVTLDLMALHPLAGQPPASLHAGGHPAPDHRLLHGAGPTRRSPAQRVSFGTSGHRGSSLLGSFNEAHILAITQAICEYRAQNGVDGPLFLAKDTHALSEPAFATALEVLAANGVDVMIDADLGYTPTPALSHAILTYNARPRRRTGRRHRDHAVAQSARGRRLQVQSAQRRPRRYRRHQVDREPRQRDPRRRTARRAPLRLREGARRPHDASPRLLSAVTSNDLAAVRRSGRHPRRETLARRRSARRRGRRLLGAASPTATVSRWRSRTTIPTRRSASCRSIGTARSAWTARRRTRWPD